MRSHSYLNTCKAILQTYDGSIPLASWLKQFFKADKKFGSKDRKQISHLCYCYYRTGNAFQSYSIDERILIGTFLCSEEPNKVLEELKPEWNEKVTLPVLEKLKEAGEGKVETIFPWNDELSKEIELLSFSQSFLTQPDLFMRARPGRKSFVEKQLKEAGIDFHLLGDDCIRLSNQSKLDDILQIDRDVVVQDLNSQKVLDAFINSKPQTPHSKLSLWDCCAASGGKSILFHDRFPNSRLTVSDVRETILINLQKRFRRAGITNYESFIADVSSPKFSIAKKFDVVICDAPCSGSGTWGRTPEQLNLFKRERIDHYAGLQKSIALNASKAVKPKGSFLYITCSVFAKENEEVVNFILKNTGLQLQSMEYLKGYEKKADTLFTALFTAL